MSEKDLIPFGLPGNEERDKAIRAKVKGTASDKRKIAQQLIALRKARPETIEQKAMQLVANPKVSSLEIMRMIQVLKERQDLSDTLQVMLIGKAIDAHKAIFGTKSFNVNMELNPQSSKSIHEIYLEVLNESNNKSNNESTNKSTDSESDRERTTEKDAEREER